MFNTIAIGAEYLKQTYGVKRVMIMDWDVHHGNGTQDSFYEDPSVLYVSTHQFPYYPGTGAIDDLGQTPAKATRSISLFRRVRRCGVPSGLLRPRPSCVRKNSAPQWILVSAGFDPHRRDPFGGMGLTEAGFAGMARLLFQLADRYAGRHIAFLLEGGYDLAALRNSVAAVLNALRHQESISDELTVSAGERLQPLIRRIQQVHEKYRY